MNWNMLKMVQQLKAINNPKEAAMQALKNASSQGNIVAQGLLKDIESGNMDSVQNTLSNFMNTKGIDINELMKNI